MGKEFLEEHDRLLPASSGKGQHVLVASSVKVPSRGSINVGKWWEWVTTRYTEPFDPKTEGASFWYTCGGHPHASSLDEAGERAAPPWLANLYAFPNWSLVSHYFNTGMALNLLSTPVTYYLVESLDASSAVTNTYLALTYLPWCLKVFFGLQSDLVPWFGMHRRSYYVLGWLVFFMCNVWLAILARPGVAATLLLSFVMVLGCLLADTVADAIVLECTTAGEAPGRTGLMRTHAYIVRQVGSTVGSLLGAIIYNSRSDGGTWSWGLSIADCFWLQALCVGASIFPLLPFMYELPVRGAASRRQVWDSFFAFVSNPGVAVPLLYLYFFNLCYVSNPAWYNFMYDGLGFSNLEVGLLYTVGSLLSVAGLLAYERYFFHSAWRPLYLWTTLLGAAFSLLQVLLVAGYTFGLPAIVFATGDASLQDFVQMIVFLPTCIMFFAMIPPGTEGTTYAIITTWQNVAAEVGYDLGTALACTVNDSNSSIENHHWTGILKLTIICSLIQVLPAAFIYAKTPAGIRLLPNSIDETKEQCDKHFGRPNRPAAYLFVFLFVGSIVASMGEALYVVFYPRAC